MKFENTIISKIVHTNIAGYCPHCNYVTNIGNVTININIDLMPDASVSSIALSEHRAMNLMTSNNETTLINVLCPNCGAHCIIVDATIADSISKLNTHNFITTASCDGEDSYCVGYVRFAAHSYAEILSKLKKAAKSKEIPFYEFQEDISRTYHIAFSDMGIYEDQTGHFPTDLANFIDDYLV